MDTIIIRPCTVAELHAAPNLSTLLSEYAIECAINGIGEASPQFDTYRMLEASGHVRMFGAFLDDFLIGFLVAIVNELPHYGQVAAATESFFVGSEYRKTGAGLALLRAAMESAREAGAVGFLVSAPTNSRLVSILPGAGFRETNRVFFKAFGDE